MPTRRLFWRRDRCGPGRCATPAAARPTAAVAQLGSTGKLRAAINYGNPILAARGEMKASGYVAEALRRHRIEGAAVAPPGRAG